MTAHERRSRKAHNDRMAKEAIKNAVDAAKRQWGDGWSMLSEDMRTAFVRASVLTQIAGMDEDTVNAGICRRIIHIASEACKVDV